MSQLCLAFSLAMGYNLGYKSISVFLCSKGIAKDIARVKIRYLEEKKK